MVLRRRCRLNPPARRLAGGFSLVELSLTLLLGSVLSALMLQLLLSEGRHGQKLARLLRERQSSARAVQLIRAELQQAREVRLGGEIQAGLAGSCATAGRQLVLQLHSTAGTITYARGPARDPIWRGEVVWRCGPAYDRLGALTSAAPQTRVLIDALPPGAGLAAVSQQGVVQVRLDRLGGHQVIQAISRGSDAVP
jgi:hypothetical protein